MSEKRIQFNNVVQNQLPLYVQSDYPLVAEFLKSYYQGQEYQGGPIDLVQNIDEYIKVDKTTNLTSSVGLGASVGISSETISVDMQNYPTGTDGFPSSYGLLKINDEIIKVNSVGIGSTTTVEVTRGVLGTQAGVHTIGAGITAFESPRIGGKEGSTGSPFTFAFPL